MFGAGASFLRATFGNRANFSSAKFGYDGHFWGATFGDRANFSFAMFGEMADFRRATFGAEADFIQARFGYQANFHRSTFGASADFRDVKFGAEANFGFAAFGANACFRHTRLPDADLRYVVGFVPDETLIRGARFSARARDPWSILRADFTGPRLFFNLLFLTLFFLPLVARTVGYYAGGQAQEQALGIVDSLERRLAAEPPAHPELAPLLRDQLAALRAHLPDRRQPEGGRWRESRVWKAVLGADRGFLIWLPAVLLLIYNVGRGFMTFMVSGLRDAEERSGITPALAPRTWNHARERYCEDHQIEKEACFKYPRAPWRRARITWNWLAGYLEAYGWLTRPHRVLRVLFWLAVLSFAWNAVHWLFQPIWLPA